MKPVKATQWVPWQRTAGKSHPAKARPAGR